MKRSLVFALVLGFGPSATAQEIKVLEAGGQKLEPGGVTRLTFGGESGVPILRVLAKGIGIGTTTYGASFSSYGETTLRLCVTPCKLELPNGIYEFKAGESLLFSPPFQITAAGPDQRWIVEDSNGGLGALGIMGTGIGLGGVLGGGLVWAITSDEEVKRPMLVLSGVSAGLTALGIWALIAAFGDAEQAE